MQFRYILDNNCCCHWLQFEGTASEPWMKDQHEDYIVKFMDAYGSVVGKWCHERVLDGNRGAIPGATYGSISLIHTLCSAKNKLALCGIKLTDASQREKTFGTVCSISPAVWLLNIPSYLSDRLPA